MTTKTILIIDDSESVRRQVEEALKPSGYHVMHARDGIEGMEVALGSKNIALIICDINMPRLTGLEMLARLKAAGSEVPAVVLTTEVAASMIQEAKESGARSWIVKPFRAELLRAAVDRLTGG